jgi:hypothetical protein
MEMTPFPRHDLRHFTQPPRRRRPVRNGAVGVLSVLTLWVALIDPTALISLVAIGGLGALVVAVVALRGAWRAWQRPMGIPTVVPRTGRLDGAPSTGYGVTPRSARRPPHLRA